MAERQYMVEGVQVCETAEIEYMAEGVQVSETSAAAPPAGLGIPIAAYHYNHNVGSNL